jgi:hypothetical protein
VSVEQGQDETTDEDEEDHSISAILLDLSREDQIQFELATSGILSAVTLATAPPGIKGHIIRAAALILPAIAVFHWSVTNSRFSNEELYFEHTYRVVEFLGIIVAFHVIHASVSLVLPALPISVGAAFAHLVGAIVLTLISILFIEFIYHAYILFWGTATSIYASSAAESVENPDGPVDAIANYFLYQFSGQLSYLLLRDNIPEGDSEELQDLRGFVSEIEEALEDDEDPSLSRLFIVAAVIVVPVFAIIAYLLSASVVRIPYLDVVLILFATRITKHTIEVPALIFGTLSFPSYLQTNLRTILTIAVYTASVYWLFFA